MLYCQVFFSALTCVTTPVFRALIGCASTHLSNQDIYPGPNGGRIIYRESTFFACCLWKMYYNIFLYSAASVWRKCRTSGIMSEKLPWYV